MTFDLPTPTTGANDRIPGQDSVALLQVLDLGEAISDLEMTVHSNRNRGEGKHRLVCVCVCVCVYMSHRLVCNRV